MRVLWMMPWKGKMFIKQRDFFSGVDRLRIYEV